MNFDIDRMQYLTTLPFTADTFYTYLPDIVNIVDRVNLYLSSMVFTPIPNVKDFAMGCSCCWRLANLPVFSSIFLSSKHEIYRYIVRSVLGEFYLPFACTIYNISITTDSVHDPLQIVQSPKELALQLFTIQSEYTCDYLATISILFNGGIKNVFVRELDELRYQLEQRRNN